MQKTLSDLAVEFVNMLVPGHFDDAEKWIDDHCTYAYQDKILRGTQVLGAFKESHDGAAKKLDSIEYLPGEIEEALPDGAIVGVADRISLNGKMHVYRDRLKVRFAQSNDLFKIIQIEHLPIQAERDQLNVFLDEAGPNCR